MMKLRNGGLGLLFALLTWTSLPAKADQPVTGSGEWYYEIGGAEPISPSPNPGVRSIFINGSAGLSIGGTCSNLDPILSVSNILNDVRSGIDQFEDAMVLAANSVIAALPAIILQRANPGLYDHFQNAVLAARARVEVATRSCEQIVQAAQNGQNPFDGWVSISRGYSWDRELAEPGNDPVTAKNDVEAANGDDGIPWFGGDAGGAGQPPIQVINDVASAGYNVTLNRNPSAQGAPPIIPGIRLLQLWSTPQQAATWAAEVMGDVTVQTCQSCTRAATTPGTGLLPKYESDKRFVGAALLDLVNDRTAITIPNLQTVSAAGVVVSRQLVEAMRNTPDRQERRLLVGKLSADIASARVIEQALTARRLLITGSRLPEVVANQKATEFINESVHVIEREIDNFLFESDVRQKLVSSTAMRILDIEKARRIRSLQSPNTNAQDPDAVINGRIENNQNP